MGKLWLSPHLIPFPLLISKSPDFLSPPNLFVIYYMFKWPVIPFSRSSCQLSTTSPLFPSQILSFGQTSVVAFAPVSSSCLLEYHQQEHGEHRKIRIPVLGQRG